MLAFNQMAAQVEVRDCDGTVGLFARLRQLSTENPAVALACSAQLASAVQREFIVHQAFTEALVRQPDVARRYIHLVLDRPWLADAGYFPIARVALPLVETEPRVASRLLIIAANRHPSVALREVQNYINLSCGREVFEAAVLASPGEAVGLATTHSATGQAVLKALQGSRHPELRTLASLAADQSWDVNIRERMAVFAGELAAGRLTLERTAQLAGNKAYFPTVVKLRIDATGSRAAALDGVLQNDAQILLRSLQGRGGLRNR